MTDCGSNTYILGISAFYHDAAACLLKDGEIIAAAEEERFTRKKHDSNFPVHAINYCLTAAGITAKDLSFVAFYDKPLLKFSRILESYLAFAPTGIRLFIKAVPLWIKKKLWTRDIIHKELPGYGGKIIFTEHHESHGASAFYPSPFQEAAFLTMDGVGEWSTTSFGVGKDNRLDIMADVHFPHSLGLLYSAFTYYCGFKVNSGEYKLMGLAPYGEPTYKDKILTELIDLKEDGSFRLNMDYFNYCAGLTMTNENFHRLFGGPPRRPETESELTQRHMDIARSIQEVTEEVVVRMARHVRKETGQRRLCMAGGVALNCVANGRLLREGIFDDIWIQPAAGDSGGALGAALFVWYRYLGKDRDVNKTNHIGQLGRQFDMQKGSLLGPHFSNDEVAAYLTGVEAAFDVLSTDEIPGRVADLIASENVVGWFQGRMEFGPRALGARSILADARSPEMQKKINQKIKFREGFRPFAPAVLAEKAGEYFELDRESPYMLFTAGVKKERCPELSPDDERLTGLEKLKVLRSDIPAVTHVDLSARVQTVHRNTNRLFYDLLTRLDKDHGTAVVINTSFNVRGEPIVCTPEDAFLCFMRTGMDYLMIGNCLLDKARQKPFNRNNSARQGVRAD